MRQWFPAANVRFHGRLPHQQVDAMWPGYDVFVQTSEFEGTSVSMLEAMAHGVVPVVTAASSGVAGVVHHGSNGFVVPVGDMAAMAQSIARLAANHTLLASNGHGAYHSAKAFAMERYCERFIEVLDRVLKSPRNFEHTKCEGGFGGHHPLYQQLQVVRTQEAELAELRARRPQKTWVRRTFRKFREGVKARLKKGGNRPAQQERKAA
jgi:hypothetical protein